MERKEIWCCASSASRESQAPLAVFQPDRMGGGDSWQTEAAETQQAGYGEGQVCAVDMVKVKVTGTVSVFGKVEYWFVHTSESHRSRIRRRWRLVASQQRRSGRWECIDRRRRRRAGRCSPAAWTTACWAAAWLWLCLWW